MRIIIFYICQKIEMKTSTLFTLLLLLSGTIKAQSFSNASFETWANPNYCSANTTPEGWITYSNGLGAIDKSDYTICPHTIPGSASHGNVSARFVSNNTSGGEGAYQNINGFTVGNTYTISFDYAGSNLYGGTGDVQFHLFIDDALVTSTPVFSPSKNTWSTHHYSFTATSSTHKIGIRLYIATSPSNGEGEADNFVIHQGNTTSLDLLNPNKLTVYPNPSNDVFTIHSKELKNASVEVYNSLGELVLHDNNINSEFLEINLLNEPSGIYLLKLMNKDSYIIQKLIKK